MDDETVRFINDLDFDNLYNSLTENFHSYVPRYDKEILEAIGLIGVNFQRLENMARILLLTLLDIRDRGKIGQIIVSKMSFSDLLGTIRSLSSEISFHRMSDLDTLLIKAYKAEEIRNRIVHSLWFTNFRIKIKFEKIQMEMFNHRDLSCIANQIEKLAASIDAITWSYIDYCKNQGKPIKGIETE